MANIQGTLGNDTIIGDDTDAQGSGGDDVIHGGAGNDIIDGRGGNNFLYGDDGDDLIKLGNQAVQGGHLRSVIDGGAGYDTLDLLGSGYFHLTTSDGSILSIDEKTSLTGQLLGTHQATNIEAIQLDGFRSSIDLRNAVQNFKVTLNGDNAEVWTGRGDDIVIGTGDQNDNLFIHYLGGNDQFLLGGDDGGIMIDAISGAADHLVVDGRSVDSVYLTSNAIWGRGAYIDLSVHSITIGATTIDTGHMLRVGTATSDHPVTALGSGDDDDLLLGNGPGTSTVIVDGRAGNDELSAYGNVRLWGGTGSDYIYADQGNEWVNGDGAVTDSAQSPARDPGGPDTITSGSGNDHVYGYSQFAVAGTPDGADQIYSGMGGDYANGNAGSDFIEGGPGSDRLYGGSGDDQIYGEDRADPNNFLGPPGNDHINGNKGNDSLHGNDGNDAVYGGQDDDVCFGDDGDDIVSGDVGNDSVNGGAGLDTLTGGAGHDVFFFEGTDAAFVLNGGSGGAADLITDFHHGEDRISLAFVPATLLDGTAANFASALAAAQQLLDDHAGDHEAAAMQVGADRFLFYASDGGAHINSAVRLLNVDYMVLTPADFQ